MLRSPNLLDNLNSLWTFHFGICVNGPFQKAEDASSVARQTAAELLPLVYGELRRLAAARLAQEKPGQTLVPTALVHEAYLRLIRDQDREYADSKHFYCAAATAMRRILIEEARRKSRVKHGGLAQRVAVTETALLTSLIPDDLLALDEALDRLAAFEPEAARLVELR